MSLQNECANEILKRFYSNSAFPIVHLDSLSKNQNFVKSFLVHINYPKPKIPGTNTYRLQVITNFMESLQILPSIAPKFNYVGNYI